MHRAAFFLVFIATGGFAQDAAPTRSDWGNYNGTQFSWRYSALDQVNTSNVKQLSPVWMFQTGDTVDGLYSTPVVVDGVMYVITPSAWVYALDAATGRVIWQYRPPRSQPGLAGAFGTVHRGLAVANGAVYF